MTKEERDILIRIDQKVTDMSENCDRHSKEIGELFNRTDKNSNNIAKIAGGVAAAVTIMTLVVSFLR